ncbi:MAG: periplasmic heavy metal sensor [Candidatus Omnitrophica bacterium]|nr:periplasmic heavy metal sensor [Candidatus Omnitrophota bacterium]
MKKTALCLAAAGFLMTASGAACEGIAGEEFRGRMQEKVFEAVIEDLDLSAEQQARIRRQRRRQRALKKELREKGRALRKELRAELEKETTDHAKVNSLSGRIKELMSRGTDARIEGILETKEILSVDQFKKLNVRMEEMRRERKERRRKKFPE